MSIAPVFDDREMHDSKECFHHKTMLIWFVYLIHKASLYQKLTDSSCLGTKSIKRLLFNADCWCLLECRWRLALSVRWSSNLPGISMKGLSWFLKGEKKVGTLQTSYLMIMNKSNQVIAAGNFSLSILSLLPLITCASSSKIGWPNT